MPYGVVCEVVVARDAPAELRVPHRVVSELGVGDRAVSELRGADAVCRDLRIGSAPEATNSATSATAMAGDDMMRLSIVLPPGQLLAHEPNAPCAICCILRRQHPRFVNSEYFALSVGVPSGLAPWSAEVAPNVPSSLDYALCARVPGPAQLPRGPFFLEGVPLVILIWHRFQPLSSQPACAESAVRGGTAAVGACMAPTAGQTVMRGGRARSRPSSARRARTRPCGR